MLSKKTKNLIFKAGIAFSIAVGTSVVPLPGIDTTIEVEATTNQAIGELTVTANSLWAYSKPNWNAKTKTFSKGTKLTVIETLVVEGTPMHKLSNGLYTTANSKYVAYKGLSNTVQALPSTGSVKTTANLNMRKGPGTGYKSLRTIPKGATIREISTSNGWTKLEYKGLTGYASSKYLSGLGTLTTPTPAPVPTPIPETPSLDSTGTATVLGNLNMRSGPDASHSRVLVLPAKAAVKVLGVEKGWYKLEYNGKTGWASGKYLKVVLASTSPKPTTPTPAPAPIPVVDNTAGTYQVSANLNMRKGPGTSNGVVLVLAKGTSITVISTSDGWSKVEYNGKTGYVSFKYLVKTSVPIPVPVPVEPVPTPNPEPVPVPVPTPEPIPIPEPVPVPEPIPVPVVEVRLYARTTANLNVRSGPSSSSGIVTSIPRGLAVKVLSEKDGWSEIEYNGIKGFSSTTYLENIPDNENVLIRPTVAIENLKSGDNVPLGSFVVKGNLSDKTVTSVSVFINGVLQGSAGASNGVFNYTLNPALMTKEINTLKIEYSNSNGKYSDAVMLKGTMTNSYSFEALKNNADYYLQIEYAKKPVYLVGASRTATMDEIRKEMDASNFIYDNVSKYMFLDISYQEGETNATAESLNSMLVGKGILEGTGAYFLRAANENHVNPFYLVAHALLETGNGKSVLASGQYVTGKYSSFGNLSSTILEIPEEDKTKLVYNMYGIGAYDGNANLWGAQLAYTNNWFTVEDAIVGGAKWISLNYINRTSSPQNTLFKMRWNFSENMSHQYATDIQWAYKQANRIKAQFDSMGVTSQLKFTVPVFTEN